MICQSKASSKATAWLAAASVEQPSPSPRAHRFVWCSQNGLTWRTYSRNIIACLRPYKVQLQVFHHHRGTECLQGHPVALWFGLFSVFQQTWKEKEVMLLKPLPCWIYWWDKKLCLVLVQCLYIEMAQAVETFSLGRKDLLILNS